MRKIAYTIVVLLFALSIYMSVPTKPQVTEPVVQDTPKEVEVIPDPRAERIDAYYKKRNMPLEGYGKKMVEEADKNGIDWRLLPAISVKESSGGKYMCKDKANAFGWASCKVHFASIDEAIETVARNLGGNNPRTHAYYKGDTYAKLYSYNGTVEALYPSRVISIMQQF